MPLPSNYGSVSCGFGPLTMCSPTFLPQQYKESVSIVLNQLQRFCTLTRRTCPIGSISQEQKCGFDTVNETCIFTSSKISETYLPASLTETTAVHMVMMHVDGPSTRHSVNRGASLCYGLKLEAYINPDKSSPQTCSPPFPSSALHTWNGKTYTGPHITNRLSTKQ